jgi:hypothetical protein
MAVLARPVQSKHRLQNTQQLIQCGLRQTPNALNKTIPINSPQLISYNMAIFAIKLASHAKRLSMSTSCKGRNTKSTK